MNVDKNLDINTLREELQTIADKLVSSKAVCKNCFQHYSLERSNAISFPKQKGDRGIVIDAISEESKEKTLDVTKYSHAVVVPKKIGDGFVTDVLSLKNTQEKFTNMFLKFIDKIEVDCITALQYGASNVVSFNYVIKGDTLVFNPSKKENFKRIINRHSLQPVISNNCPENLAFDLSCSDVSSVYKSSRPSYGPYGPYGPDQPGKLDLVPYKGYLGFYIERRPVTVTIKPMEREKKWGIYMTTRYGIVVLDGGKITKIQM